MVENKAHQQQIKKIRGDLLNAHSETNKGESTQKLLLEKRKYNPIVEEKSKNTYYTAYSGLRAN